MDQAWLDSLSEDWVSQHGSSGSPAPSLPSYPNSTVGSESCLRPASRTSKSAPTNQATPSAHDSSNIPLSERSLNEINIQLSQRNAPRPSKLRDELANSTRGRRLSASSSQSVVYNTVQHKSHSSSPRKGITETPEWKKRLLQGDVAYGDQKDLFSAAGLESIFRPPPSNTESPAKRAPTFGEGSIMPSSPPPYDVGRQGSSAASNANPRENTNTQVQDEQQPRGMKYRMTDTGSSQFSDNDLSRSSDFHPKRPGQAEMKHPEHTTTSSPTRNSTVQGDLLEAATRLVSGQSIIRNEVFSPIYISKHNTSDGKIDYSPLDETAEEPKKQAADGKIDDKESPVPVEDEASELLPDEAITETDRFAHDGRFVTVQRGSLSHDRSFQKRILTPNSLPPIDESAMLPEESIQASTPKQLPTIKKSRASDEYERHHSSDISPTTAEAAPKKDEPQISRPGSGSPLKLFGAYDTFTNERLLRRLSQFEELSENNNEDEAQQAPREGSTRQEKTESSVPPSPSKTPQRGRTDVSRKISSFGAGDLDSYQFSEDVTYDPNQTNSEEYEGSFGEEEDKENVSLPVLDPKTQSRFRFHLDPSPSIEGSFLRQPRERNTSATSSARRVVTIRRSTRPRTGSSAISSILPLSGEIENLQTPRKKTGDFEGKRLQYSPLKDPTPKRRRTLPKNELSEDRDAVDDSQLDSIRDTHEQMQHVIGRKRRDAQYDNEQQTATSSVLAMRQLLRPRTPTPSQRSSIQERSPLTELSSSARARLQQEKIAKIQAELDATNPFKLSMQNDSRKGSVTTQDFLDEAKKIMLAIRGKTRPRSGLTSLEESENETDRNATAESVLDEQDEEFEDSYQESSLEPFSRPPSREGKPVPRMAQTQQDPVVLDHLRKYEERSDLEDIIAASMRSIAMVKDAANTAERIDRLVDETIMRTSSRLQEDVVESDPPNIRITHNPDLARKRKHSPSSGAGGSDFNRDRDFNSQGSTSSESSSRSIPTASSRGSDTRRIIVPHTVSHLIPEQLAGMVFDQERKVWVKRRASADERGSNYLPSDETEEDPFGDIPDLSVNEAEELERVKAVAAKQKEEAKAAELRDEEQNTHLSEESGAESPDCASGKSTPARESTGSLELGSRRSSVNIEPGYTSVETVQHHHTTTKTEIKGTYEEVEREISIHEDRLESESPRRRRNVTISFSSPVASVIQPQTYEDEKAQLENDASLRGDSEDEGADNSIIVHKQTSRKSSGTRIRSAMRGSLRRPSIGGHFFPARPVSRIDEQDEESFAKREKEEDMRRSVSLILTTPAPVQREMRTTSIIIATPQPLAHEIGTLELTPLSDFTMNQADESFGMEVSYIAKGQRFVPGSGNKRTLSNSIKELVAKLTEVEPYEPFWEHMKQLELKNKKLTNMHKLDEFCEQLEELDVSNNQISHLNGAPQTIRHLRISHNLLSDLTAWGHLSNLQYIDISNNEVESLSAFKYQVHLRGLRADNNKIKSLDGISHLDGLLSLRLRGNLVESLDFAGTRLQRLTDLDLKDNQVSEIRNLQKLVSLTHLNLEENNLEEFPNQECFTPWSLKYLKLSGNKLTSLDISQCPNLRLLYLDRNRLGDVTGFFATKHLDSLSMREQQDGAIINQDFLSQAFEVRKLFLSGNLLTTFTPRYDFLNLQYLELANCGLESLPFDFGQIFSNVRTLNLNSNALKDTSPLLGITRLKKLHIAGNRIGRLRQTASILVQLRSLRKVDLRNNLLTLGFYPPMMEKRAVIQDGLDESAEDGFMQEPYTLSDVEQGRDAKYVACLDMETRMRRRVYEILVLASCVGLRVLDGLTIDREVLNLRDKVWNALVTAGVIIGEPGNSDNYHDNNHVENGGESTAEPDAKSAPQSEVEVTKSGFTAAGAKDLALKAEKETPVRATDHADSDIWDAEDSFA
ncbi:wd repeat domain-containing protein [Phlyctema vagabunda]|uniref:Wd repeat domain-containing protein n=1 Tax=Phlyctema vagabunda TaxID=108571 RepID=A0ABR4PDS1_9HELO